MNTPILGTLRLSRHRFTATEGAVTDIWLIYVPFMAGDATHPVSQAPAHYARAGAEKLLAGRGILASSYRIDTGAAALRGGPAASAAVNQVLRRTVRSAVTAGRLPVLPAGSCDAATGVAAGLNPGRCGLVWVDAHAGFNTPQSSASDLFPGMSRATVTGHCHQQLWASLGGRSPLPEELAVLAGVRSLSPAAKARRPHGSAICVIAWENGGPHGDITPALDRSASQADEVSLHIDNDALDPATAPGVVDQPVPGGLSPAQMEELIHAVAARLPIAAATTATCTPRQRPSRPDPDRRPAHHRALGRARCTKPESRRPEPNSRSTI